MIKILMIAYYFPPTGGAGVQRSLKFAQYLPIEGYLPTVITAPGLAADRWSPQDETLLSTIPKEVTVHRVPGSAGISSGKWRRRMETWGGWPSKFAAWWVHSATQLALNVFRDERLIFATMSPWESGTVAKQVSERLGIPWVADLRDPWALDEMEVYPTLLHRALERHKMERLLRTARVIIMNTPEASAALKEQFPSLRKKDVICITNGFDGEEFSCPITARSDGKFRIVHSGYLHTDRGLQLRSNSLRRLCGGAESGVDILTRSHAVLLEAIDRLCRERPQVRQDLELILAGESARDDRTLADRSPVASLVRFTGYLSHPESLALIRNADLLFLPMHNLPPGKRARIIPGKTYEYMATGRPILAAVPDGDAREFLSKSGSALICRPDDVPAMARILDRVYEAWLKGEPVAKPTAFASQFDRKNLVSELAQAFDRVLKIDSRADRPVAQMMV